ncbi:MAG: nitroreductase family protein, partial [Acidimicrobiales bacterium]|nr:nitroreductase family protein [Acidimicrobiales bacterium]
MTRAYTSERVPAELVDRILDLARRGPSAGKTESPHFLVLEGADVTRYWDTTLAPEKRPAFPWPQLLDAPVLIIPWIEPGAY